MTDNLYVSMHFREVADFRILRPHGLSRDIRVLAFCPDDQVEDRWSFVQQFRSACQLQSSGDAGSRGGLCRQPPPSRNLRSSKNRFLLVGECPVTA